MTWFLWARMGVGSHREKEYDTDSERSERDIEKMALFTIASKRIKHLGINLPKEPKDQYSKIYKILMKEMKMEETDGKLYHVFGSEESILSK